MKKELKFEVVTIKNGTKIELYHEMFGDLLSPCEWARGCPLKGEQELNCEDCPANEKTNPMKLTQKEAIDWWKNIEL